MSTSRNLIHAISLLFVLSLYGQNNLNANNQSTFDGAILLQAIESENYDLVEQIIVEEKLDLNTYYEGKTFLIHATIKNKPEMVRLLFSYGADITMPCEHGYSPEEYAQFNEAYNAWAEIAVIKA